MKLKVYGSTGSFPRAMKNDELLEKFYHYQKRINEEGGFNNFIQNRGLENSLDREGNLSFDKFQEMVQNESNFDFWIGNTYGGNSTCLYLNTDDDKHISFDAGSGFINLSKDLIKLPGFKKNLEEIYIFLTHFHWDHIQGIPFSALIFTQNKMKFVGMPVDNKVNIKSILNNQMNKYNFPIPLDYVNKSISFYEVKEKVKIGKHTEITPFFMEHPLIGSYTYKIENLNSGKSIVFATDFEQPVDKLEDRFIDICRDSDVLIIDAHFTPGEATNFEGWGHGNFGNAVDLARLSGIKTLILFHHNFNKTDRELYKIEKNVEGYLKVSKESFKDVNLEVMVASEGLELEI